MAQPRKKVRIISPILVEGEHAQPGDVFDVPVSTAHELIGAGTAVAHLEPGEKPDPAPSTVNRMLQPQNADPPPSKVSSGKGSREAATGRPLIVETDGVRNVVTASGEILREATPADEAAARRK